MLVAAAVLALVVVGGLVALSTGEPVPSELRSPARALGLPVDSAELAEARTAMATLRAALSQPDDRRLLAARDALVRRVQRLGAEDRTAIDGDARALLDRADTRLQRVAFGDTADAAREPVAGAAPVEPSGPAPESGSGAGTAVEPEPSVPTAAPAADTESGEESVDPPELAEPSEPSEPSEPNQAEVELPEGLDS
jgi:hypothetical protein